MKPTLLFLIIAASAVPADAQQPREIRGTVVRAGQPVPGANVFVLETLDGALSDSAGRFSFITRATTPATLIVQCLSCAELRVPLDARAEWLLEVRGNVIALPALQVSASRFTVGNTPDAQLDALGVVRTPGAAADVYRALQTFPGLQTGR